jgi:hypothetical protein
MFEAQILRRDSDLFASLPILDEESQPDPVRPYLTAQDTRLLSFTPANDEAEQPHSIVPSLLAGIGASISTMVLFSVVGIVSTLGMPQAGGATATFI